MNFDELKKDIQETMGRVLEETMGIKWFLKHPAAEEKRIGGKFLVEARFAEEELD